LKAFIKTLTCIIATTSLIACSSNPTKTNTSLNNNTPKTKKVEEKKKIAVIKLLSPTTISPQPDSSGAVGGAVGGLVGGLIGAAISASIQKERLKAMKPISDNLTDYNIQNVFNKKLSTLSGPLFAKDLTVKNYRRHPVVNSRELSVIANYYLMPNHLELSVDAMIEVALHENEDEYGDPAGKQEGVFDTYSIKTKIPKSNKKEATEYLAKNPAVLKNMINASLDKIVAKISKKLNNYKYK